MWRQFLEHLRHTNGDLSAFWMSYIQLVGDVLLGLIRASREGNWQLHLFAICQMIPWCFAYDKMNYARYLPVYYAQMTKEHTREVQGIRVQKISAQQVIKQWRQFLHQLMNKTSLIKFLVSEWRKPQYLERLLRQGKSLFVTCEDKCWKLSGECCEEISELCSCHEEADGRLLLHATHAAQEG